MKFHHSAWPAEPGHANLPTASLLSSPAPASLHSASSRNSMPATQWSSKCGPQTAVPDLQHRHQSCKVRNAKPWVTHRITESETRVRAPAIYVLTALSWFWCLLKFETTVVFLQVQFCHGAFFCHRTPCLATSQSSSSIIQTLGEISALERIFPWPSYLKWTSLLLLIPIYTIILLISPQNYQKWSYLFVSLLSPPLTGEQTPIFHTMGSQCPE